MFRARARIAASAIAVEHGDRRIGYGELLDRVNRASAMLAALGLVRGDRVALLSRNRPEYLEIELAAANLGVITACLNWRLSARELSYCIDLVSPKVLIVEPELAATAGATDDQARTTIGIGAEYERLLARYGGSSRRLSPNRKMVS